jgi:hypothetical protein
MGMGGLFPFVLGHEISGRVIEAGPECRHAVGTRVAVEPCIPCAARGIEPSCANCARGWTSSCLDLDSRVVTGGRSLGFTQGLGGERGEQVLAHVSMLQSSPRRGVRPRREPARAGLDCLPRHPPHAAPRWRASTRCRCRHHRTCRPGSARVLAVARGSSSTADRAG